MLWYDITRYSWQAALLYHFPDVWHLARNHIYSPPSDERSKVTLEYRRFDMLLLGTGLNNLLGVLNKNFVTFKVLPVFQMFGNLLFLKLHVVTLLISKTDRRHLSF